MALFDIFCERCPACGGGQMTPPFVRSGEAWQACFDCGQPVVLKIQRRLSKTSSDSEPLGRQTRAVSSDIIAPSDGERSALEEARLRRRYEVLLKALEGMLVSEAEYRKSRGVVRPEPELVAAARQDLRDAVQSIESATVAGKSPRGSAIPRPKSGRATQQVCPR